MEKLEGFPGGTVVKNPPANAGDARDTDSVPGEEIPWRRKSLPTPVFLSGKFHRQRSLAGYSPWVLLPSSGRAKHVLIHQISSYQAVTYSKKWLQILNN